MFRTDQDEDSLRAAQEWVDRRHRAGNWFDVAPTDEIPSGVVPEFRTILHAFQLWFAPEIRERLDEGKIDDSFVLHRAQLLQWADDRPTEI